MSFIEKATNWLVAAPPAALLALCVGLSGWVWALEAEVSRQGAEVAVAAEQAASTQRSQMIVNDRLTRLEAKMDVMMEVLVDMRATMRRIDKEHLDR